ncbi:MAG TPA: hypothetical protein EYO58_03780, partial [Flavobacteriales bacterium]|nr:hypothetical protein [Flavobacteriales bacterium]
TLSNNHLTNQLTILFTDNNPTIGANGSNFNADYQGAIIYDSNSWILYYFDGTFFKMVQLLITEYKGYLYINIEKARAFATGTFDTTKIKHYWDNATYPGVTFPSGGGGGYGIGGINFDYFGTIYTVGVVTDITTGVISDWKNTDIPHKSLKVDSLDGNVTGDVTGDVTGNAGTVTNGVYKTSSTTQIIEYTGSSTDTSTKTIPVLTLKSSTSSIDSYGCLLELKAKDSTLGYGIKRIKGIAGGLSLFSRDSTVSNGGDIDELIVTPGKVQIVKLLEVQGSGIVIKDNGNIGSVTKPTAITIAPTGYVGIGINPPSAPLHIGITNQLSQTGYWQGGPSSTAFSNGTFASDVSIKTLGVIWSEDHFRASSDSRIKTNIVDVPGTLALQMIRDIPCRYYEHVDKSKGTDKIIGFIAQEVKKVLPMAVSLNKNIIPDVMTVVVGTWDTSHNFSTNSLKDCSGTKYRFYVSNNSDGKDEIMKEIICNEDGTFTFEEQYANVFCYGKEVYDFHTLDYQKIFTLHHAAIQELDKKNEELDKKLIQVDKKHEELDNTIQELKAELAKLKAV